MLELVVYTIFFIVILAVGGAFDKPMAYMRGFVYWISGEEKRDEERRAANCNNMGNHGSGCSSYGEFTPIDSDPGWETSVGIFGTDGYGDGYGHYGGGFGDGE